MFSLASKIAVVTGAGSGIGQAIAHCFAGAGATVFIADLNADAAAATADQITRLGRRAIAHVTDVADESSVARLAETVRSGAGALDILVNNAGIGHVGTMLTTKAEDLDRLYRVNVRGVFNCTHAFLPAMVEVGRGSIVNVASIGGVVAVRDRLAYTTTKFAVVGLTRSVALDHSHSGIRCNAICPGRVETPFVQARLAEYPDPAKAYRDMSATQLVGRMIRPEEVAAAALYLACDESVMVTGSCLMLDGGWSAGK